MSHKSRIASAALALSGFAAIAAATAQSLPAGNGKEMVETICQGCHDLSPITTSIGFSRADWETVIKSMIDMGADIKPDQATVIVNYLAMNFPPKQK
jgi:virginiamycin B lyase